jgi:phospholipid transport system substrate-binding protein
MMRRILVFLAAVTVLTAAAGAAVSPQQFIEELLDEYRTMKPGRAEELSAEDRAFNDQVRKDLMARLDVDKLGRLSLQDHWDKLTEQQRSEFLEVLRNVLEERSLNNIRGTREKFEVQYDGVDTLQSGDALVKTILELARDEFYVDFKLEPRGDSWIIYDVVTDDVSTVRNYRDQFNKIIAEKGFDELLRRMRDNLIEDPSASKKEPEAG